MKMTAKKRVGSRLCKWYDTAKTPYQRVLAVCEASAESKEQLQQNYLSLNPAALLRRTHHLQDELWRLAKGEILP